MLRRKNLKNLDERLIIVHIPKPRWKKLKIAAIQKDTTIREIVTGLIWGYLESRDHDQVSKKGLG